MDLPLSENRFDLDNFLYLGVVEKSISTNDQILFDYLVKRWIMLGAEYRLNDTKYDEYLIKYKHITSKRIIGEQSELCLQMSENPIIKVNKYGDYKFDGKSFSVYRLKKENIFRDIIWYKEIPICIGTSKRSKINQVTVPRLVLIHQSNLHRIRLEKNDCFKLTFDHTQTTADIPMYIENIEFLKRQDAISNNSIIRLKMDLKSYYKSEILLNKDIDKYKLYLKKIGERKLNRLRVDLQKEDKIKINALNKSEIKRLRVSLNIGKINKYNQQKKIIIEDLKNKVRKFYDDINIDSFEVHSKYPDCKFIIDIEQKILQYFDIFNLLSKRGIKCSLVFIISNDIKIRNNGKVYHKQSSNKFNTEVDRIAINLFNKLSGEIISNNSLDHELIVIQNKNNI